MVGCGKVVLGVAVWGGRGSVVMEGVKGVWKAGDVGRFVRLEIHWEVVHMYERMRSS